MYDYTNNITDGYIVYEQNNNNITDGYIVYEQNNTNITYSINNTNHRLILPMNI